LHLLRAKQIFPTYRLRHPESYNLLFSRSFTSFVTIDKLNSAFSCLSDSFPLGTTVTIILIPSTISELNGIFELFILYLYKNHAFNFSKVILYRSKNQLVFREQYIFGQNVFPHWLDLQERALIIFKIPSWIVSTFLGYYFPSFIEKIAILDMLFWVA
jgi:hypothetical protein